MRERIGVQQTEGRSVLDAVGQLSSRHLQGSVAVIFVCALSLILFSFPTYFELKASNYQYRGSYKATEEDHPGLKG